jgi:hypothetical protein
MTRKKIKFEKLKEEGALLEDLILFKDRPLPENITRYIESLFSFINRTNSLNNFEKAVKLLRKWETNLLHFYSIVNQVLIEKSPFDFDKYGNIKGSHEPKIKELNKELQEGKKISPMAGTVKQKEVADLPKKETTEQKESTLFTITKTDYPKSPNVAVPMEFLVK